jgi:hypothetical protein
MLSITLLRKVKMVFPDFAQNVISLLDPASSRLINGERDQPLYWRHSVTATRFSPAVGDSRESSLHARDLARRFLLGHSLCARFSRMQQTIGRCESPTVVLFRVNLSEQSVEVTKPGQDQGVGVMFRFRQAGDAALVLLVILIASNAKAQIIKQDEDAESNVSSGVLLDRLSAKHQEIWHAIRQVIYAEDSKGNPLHPMLKSLLEKLQTSEHSVYLEFDDSREGCRCTAGKFSIERVDPEGSANVAVIKLYLRNIDYASAPARANLKGGFAPLAGLNKLDRYAEVFGHEMAHAIDILFTPERARWIDEVLRNSEQVLPLRLLRKGRIEPEVERVLQERDAILHDLEKPAVMAEAVVWRELVESRRKRKP